MRAPRWKQSNRYKAPLPASTLVLISQAEMERRIEAIRAAAEPLPIGRICEPALLKLRAS